MDVVPNNLEGNYVVVGYMEFNSILNVVNGMTRNYRPYTYKGIGGVARSMRSTCVDASCYRVCPLQLATSELLKLYYLFFFVCPSSILVFRVPVMASPTGQQTTSSGPPSVTESTLTTTGNSNVALP